jgi:hypothetical protein
MFMCNPIFLFDDNKNEMKISMKKKRKEKKTSFVLNNGK